MRSRTTFARLLALAFLCAAAPPAAARQQTARAADDGGRGESAAPRVPWGDVRVEFEGNRIFTSEQLLRVARQCYERGRGPADAFVPDLLEYCVRRGVLDFVRRSGYARAKAGELRAEAQGAGLAVTVPLEENELYRLGEVKIEGPKHFTAEQLRSLLPLKKGDISDVPAVGLWLSEHVRRLYADDGFVQYEFEVEPEFRLDPVAGEGLLDLSVTIDEGRQFRLRRLAFEVNGYAPEDVLRGAFLLKEGDVFGAQKFADGIRGLDGLDLVEPVDKDADVDFRPSEATGELDIVIRLTEKGRGRPARRAADDTPRPSLVRARH